MRKEIIGVIAVVCVAFLSGCSSLDIKKLQAIQAQQAAVQEQQARASNFNFMVISNKLNIINLRLDKKSDKWF